MDPMTLLGIAFMLICVLFILLLIAVSKINSLHRKVTDVSPNDLYPFMEEMRELVIESERVANELEDKVRQKEEMLEDLTALIDEKLRRLETIQDEPAKPEPAPTQRHSFLDDEPEDTYETYTPPFQKPAQNQEPVEEEFPGGMSLRDMITDLAELGHSDSEIASKLSISVTEVQLVKRMSAD